MKNPLLDLKLAFRNVVRHKRRSAVAVCAVAFGIAALILASGFIEFIFEGFREQTIHSRLGHLQITRPGYHDAGKADLYAFLLPATVPTLQGPHERPQLRTVAPRLSFSGLISHRDATLSFIGDGVSPREEALFRHGFQISAGSNLSPGEPRSIIVGEGLARNLGVSLGDRVVLLASTASGGTNAVEVSIRGFFVTVTKAYDDAAIRIPISTARELLRTEGSHVWVVLLDQTSDTDKVAAELAAKLPREQFQITPWYELADLYNKTAALFSKQIQGIRLIIALIIMMSISNTMTMNVLERVSEIGTSMALGLKRSSIAALFLSEGVLLGCLGGLMGILAGLTLASIISAIGVPMPPPPGMSYGYMGEILVTWTIVLESLILAVITTLVASVYPAWSASRKNIVDALRHNR
jgi:putative ABC transport system permease protein